MGLGKFQPLLASAGLTLEKFSLGLVLIRFQIEPFPTLKEVFRRLLDKVEILWRMKSHAVDC